MCFYALSAEEIHKLNMKFDIIIAFDLIEHLIDTFSFMKNIRENLNKDSIFIFATPNGVGLEALVPYYKLPRIITAAIYPPMHLQAFNIHNIALFAYKNGFKLKHLDTAGIFDISILEILKGQIKDKNLLNLLKFNDKIKAYFQYLLSVTNGGSYMRVALKI